jgi:hypothetical protein
MIPSPYPVVHLARSVSTDLDPDTGNPVIATAAPVVRYVQSISQLGRRGSSHEVIGPDTVLRVETEFHLSVADPSVYSTDDQVLLSAELDDDGNYVDGTGTAYWVDGTPSDSRQGPWPQYLKVFGGTVRLRRVT